ncbi:MAG TPA: transglycosylase domain-containing protein, partial [Anaerolineaceae bacterium]
MPENPADIPAETPEEESTPQITPAPEQPLEQPLEQLPADPTDQPAADQVEGPSVGASTEATDLEKTPVKKPSQQDTQPPVEFVSLAGHLKNPADEGFTLGAQPAQELPPDPNKTPPKLPDSAAAGAMPLPRHVNEVDMDATSVSTSAYNNTPLQRPSSAGPGSTPPQSASQPLKRPASPSTRPPSGPAASTPPAGRPPLARPPVKMASAGRPAYPPAAPPPGGYVPARLGKAPRPARRIDFRQGLGCLLRMASIGAFFLVIALIVLGSFAVYEYYTIAATLPSVGDLRQRASQFETTRILDRNGDVLYEILDPTAGRRTYVTLDKVSPELVAATIATEDKDYYTHIGVDPIAIARAFYQNYTGGGTVSGASTITQQLARALLLTPDERAQQTYMRKVREAILATEITRRYSRDEILELYLNEIYYGNLAYGIEAASET